MTYAPWAPPELIELIESNRLSAWFLLSGRSLPRETQIRLASDPDMEATWKTLARRAKERDLPDYVDAFLYECIMSAGGPNAWERKTKGEQVKEARAIATTARQLAKLLRDTDSGLDQYVFMYLTYEERNALGITERFKRDFETGTPIRLDDVAPPKLADLLDRLAAKAERSERANRLLANPNVHNANRRYFIKRIHRYLCETYGTPLHHVVATVASIFLNEAMTIDTVRSCIRF